MFSSFKNVLKTGHFPFQEFLKSTVDLVDLFGLYLVMQRVAGKGQVKVSSDQFG